MDIAMESPGIDTSFQNSAEGETSVTATDDASSTTDTPLSQSAISQDLEAVLMADAEPDVSSASRAPTHRMRIETDRAAAVNPNTIPAAESTAVARNDKDTRSSTSAGNSRKSIRKCKEEASSGGGSSNSVPEIPRTYTELEALQTLYESTGGFFWERKSGWFSENLPSSEWHGLKILNNKVVTLDLHCIKMEGFIPDAIQGLTCLQDLHLCDNKLEGHIPKAICKLRSLITLDLSNNKFDGGIPAEIGDLSELQTLKLTKCGLSGKVPPELGKLTKLRVLYLGLNRLTRSLPAELGELVNLVECCLEDNQFEDVIPAGLFDKTVDLEELWLLKNKFEGPLPRALGNLQMLKELHTLKLAGKIYADSAGEAYEKNRFDNVPSKGVAIKENAAAVLQFRKDYCGPNAANLPRAPTQRSASKECHKRGAGGAEGGAAPKKSRLSNGGKAVAPSHGGSSSTVPLRASSCEEAETAIETKEARVASAELELKSKQKALQQEQKNFRAKERRLAKRQEEFEKQQQDFVKQQQELKQEKEDLKLVEAEREKEFRVKVREQDRLYKERLQGLTQEVEAKKKSLEKELVHQKAKLAEDHNKRNGMLDDREKEVESNEKLLRTREDAVSKKKIDLERLATKLDKDQNSLQDLDARAADIAQRLVQVEARETAASSKENSLRDRERRTEELGEQFENQMREREAAANVRENTLNTQEKRLDEVGVALKDREQAVEHKERLVNTRETNVKAMEEEIKMSKNGVGSNAGGGSSTDVNTLSDLSASMLSSSLFKPEQIAPYVAKMEEVGILTVKSFRALTEELIEDLADELQMTKWQKRGVLVGFWKDFKKPVAAADSHENS